MHVNMFNVSPVYDVDLDLRTVFMVIKVYSKTLD